MGKGEGVVHILESPKAAEILEGHHDGLALEKVLQLLRVPVRRWMPIDSETLKSALTKIIELHNNELAGDIPLLHLTLHSNAGGIGLSNGDMLPWAELAQLLAPVNVVAKGMLVVTMSSCEGFEGARMALTDQSLPFRLLVGPKSKITWPQGFMAFATFYHHMESVPKSFEDPETLLGAMATAAGLPGGTFGLAHGPEVQERFREEFDEARRMLEEGDGRALVRALSARFTAKP